MKINKILKTIKNFVFLVEKEFTYFDELKKLSKIIDNNSEYINVIRNWINIKGKIQFELLYRLSDNREEISTFHNLCDDKSPTLIFFHLKNDNKIGIFTPLSLDSTSSLKYDDDTFFIQFK